MRTIRLIAVGALMLIGRTAVACYVQAGPPVTACSGMEVTLAGAGSGVGTLQYTWYPTEGLSDPNVAQPQLVAPAITTTYTVTVTDGSGCTANDHVTVTVLPWPEALLEAGGDVITGVWGGLPGFSHCDGLPQWTFGLTDATDDISGAVRTVDPGDGAPVETIAHGGTFTHTYEAGSHTLTYTITLPGGWTTTQQYVAHVGTTPAQPVVSTNSPVCTGQVLSVSTAAVPGVSYTWTGPNGFTSTQPTFVLPGANPGMAGTYTITPRKGNCTGPATAVQVNVVVPPVLSVQPASAEVCAGESVSLQASGATNYQWTQGSQNLGTADHIDLQPAATAYVVVTGESNGCTSNTVVPVVVHPLPVVNIPALPALCDQAVPTPLAATPIGGTWSGPYVSEAGIFTPQPAATGAFALEYAVTDAYGCTGGQQVMAVVQSIDEPATAPADMSVCATTAPLQLTGLPANGVWTGDAVDADGSFDPAQPGAYTLTYAVGEGSCRTEDQTAITVHALPTVQATNVPLLCSDQGPQQLQGLPAGGTWAGANVNIAGVFDPVGLPAGDHTAIYTWADAATGCSNSAQAGITVAHLPVAQFTMVPVACAEQMLMFASEAEGSGAQLTWDMGDGHTATGAVTWHAYATPGSYTAQLTAANACGTATDAHAINVLYATTTAAIAHEALAGCAPFTASLTSAAVGDTAITWYWAGGTTTDAVFAHTFTVPGSYMVQLQADGCHTDVATAVVTVHAVPDAMIHVPATPVCVGAPITLHNATTGNTDAWWTLGDGTTSDLASWAHIFAQPGTWSIGLTATDPATGCSSTSAQTMEVPPAPVAVLAVLNDPVCVGDGVQFQQQGQHGVSYAWQFGEGGAGQGSMPTHTYAAPGAYVVSMIATGTGGCMDTASYAITVHGLPESTLTFAPVGNSDLAFQFAAPHGAAAYAWSFGDGGRSALEAPLYHFGEAGEWEVCVEVTNDAGCISEQCELVRVDGPNVVWMPSAFSPDGDGVNEKLLPVIVGANVAAYRFTVLDRWGGVLFETTDPARGWDGTAQGRIMDPGVYVWRLEWRQDGTTHERMGHVTVMR